jgi:adenylate kinase family enzyme
MIIFINGSLNTGKTTIAKLLGKEIPNSAVVEIDRLHGFIAWMDIKQAVPINLENAVSVIKNFAKRHIHVIVPYPLSNTNYKYIMDKLAKFSQEIRVFTLAPKKKVALSNRGSREIDEWEKSRIHLHYKNNLHKPNFGFVIDNSNDTPEQTLKKILSKLELKKSINP